MAKLPTQEDLGARPLPTNKTGIVQYQPSQEGQARATAAQAVGAGERAKAGAQQQLGQTLFDTGKMLFDYTMQVMENKSKQDYANAQTEFLSAKIKLASDITSDDNFETYGQRYQQGLTEIQKQAADKIKNNYLRDDFINRTNLDMVQGTAKILDVAKQKEAHLGRANLDTQLQAQLDLVSRATDDTTRNQIISAALESIDAAKGNNWLSPEQAVSIRQKFTENYARQRLLSLDDAQKVAVLKKANTEGGTWANFIPPDDRTRALAVAQNEATKGEALGIVDQYNQKNFSLEQGMDEAKKIKDPVLRQAVENRFEKSIRLQDAMKADANADTFNHFYLKVRDGKAVYDDIPQSALENMSAGQINSLHAAENQAINDRSVKNSNQNVLDTLYQLQARGAWRDARHYLMEHADELTRSDYDNWSKATAKADMPPDIKSLFTAQQTLKAKATQAGITSPDDISTLSNKMNEWYQDYQRINDGKTPDDKTLNEAMDRFLIERNNNDFLPFNSYYLYQRADSPIIMEDVIRTSDPTGYAHLIQAFREVEGRDPLPEEIIYKYQKVMGLNPTPPAKPAEKKKPTSTGSWYGK